MGREDVNSKFKEKIKKELIKFGISFGNFC
jgi:hypothetical protein